MSVSDVRTARTVTTGDFLAIDCQHPVMELGFGVVQAIVCCLSRYLLKVTCYID